MKIKHSEFKRILRQYEEKQLAHKHLLKLRKKEIYRTLPEIERIDAMIASNSIKTSLLMIEEPLKAQSYMEKLEGENLKLSLKKLKLLSEYGYPKDYLEPKYDCPLCQDTGYIGHEKCNCLKQALIDVAYEQSNIKNILTKENFDTFSFDFYSNEVDPKYSISPLDNIRLIHGKCRSFVENFDSAYTNLILYGRSGLGKTFLCNCIAKALLDGGYTVIYLTAFGLFKLFEDYKFNRSYEDISEEKIESIFSCDLLIIDDLGTELNNTFTSGELFNCLNTRLLNTKSTLISTNLMPNHWSDNYSDRIGSRIFGNYQTLLFFGEDIRLKKKFK